MTSTIKRPKTAEKRDHLGVLLDNKERRLRRWAARVVSDLPTDPADAERVLQLAEKMRGDWLGDQCAPKAGREGDAR